MAVKVVSSDVRLSWLTFLDSEPVLRASCRISWRQASRMYLRFSLVQTSRRPAASRCGRRVSWKATSQWLPSYETRGIRRLRRRRAVALRTRGLSLQHPGARVSRCQPSGSVEFPGTLVGEMNCKPSISSRQQGCAKLDTGPSWSEVTHNSACPANVGANSERSARVEPPAVDSTHTQELSVARPEAPENQSSRPPGYRR